MKDEQKTVNAHQNALPINLDIGTYVISKKMLKYVPSFKWSSLFKHMSVMNERQVCTYLVWKFSVLFFDYPYGSGVILFAFCKSIKNK